MLYVISTVGGEPHLLINNAEEGDWSPDGRQIAFLRTTVDHGRSISVIGLVSSDGSSPREIVKVEGVHLQNPRWSPDGSTIAVLRSPPEVFAGASIWLVSADGKTSRSLAAGGKYYLSSFSWSGADNQLVYFASDTPASDGALPGATAHLVRQDIASGAATTLLRISNFGYGFDIVSTGRTVFESGSSRQNLQELSLEKRGSQAQGRQLWPGTGRDRQPSYSPHGDRVIFTSNRSGNLDLWEVSLRTGNSRQITFDPANDWDPAFTRDGKNIVWSSDRSGKFEIWMADTDGNGAHQITKNADAQNPSATPDGWILYCSYTPGRNGIWKIRSDGSASTKVIAGELWVPEVSPDGQYVVYWSNTELRYCVARIADGADIRYANINGDRVRWTPDGRAIALTYSPENHADRRGIFVQEFIPGTNTDRTRRQLAIFDPGVRPETFDISPDGSRAVVSFKEETSNLMIAEHLPGILSPGRKQ